MGTGHVTGNTYRERNVVMYAPQSNRSCQSSSDVQGNGTCGVNGNIRNLKIDRVATTCSMNPVLGGYLKTKADLGSYSTTELVGRNNAILVQRWLTADALNNNEKDRIMESTLITFTKLKDGT